jgi:hypothetical protein
MEKLRSRVASTLKKAEAIKAEQKPNWEIEGNKLADAITTDQDKIQALLNRRLFMRASLSSVATRQEYSAGYAIVSTVGLPLQGHPRPQCPSKANIRRAQTLCSTRCRFVV